MREKAVRISQLKYRIKIQNAQENLKFKSTTNKHLSNVVWDILILKQRFGVYPQSMFTYLSYFNLDFNMLFSNSSKRVKSRETSSDAIAGVGDDGDREMGEMPLLF